MRDWREDKERAGKCMRQVKAILGAYLIAEAPMEEDAKRNTDLIVLRLDAVRVACRIRTHEYLARYPDEFTIRAGRPNGTKTELAKIIEGWGDYLFYGFTDADQTRLAAWLLGDLRVFRLWLMDQTRANGGKLPGAGKDNTDGSSDFRAFRINELPPDFIIARKLLA